MTKHRIRVAVVVPTHWSFRMGGSQYQAKLLIQELYDTYNADIIYFTARAAGEVDLPDHKVKSVGSPGRLRRFGHFWDYFRLKKALSEFAPDVIYQRVACSYTGIVSRYARRAGVPFIWHIASENDCRRTTSILRSLRRPQTLIEGQLTEEGIKEANVIVAQTADQIRLLGGEFGRKADRLIRNFHPIPPLLPKPTNRLTVVWIANFKPLKRPELFFEIAAFLQDLPEVEFLMIGEPYSSQRLQSYIERAVQRCSNVKYMGAMLQKDVNELLDRSHLLVNTSEWEGFSNTFIQAWMRSIPVLTLGVNPDRLFEYTYLGRCHDSTREVANSIRELASNSGILEDMGMKSRKFAVEQFSMRNAADLARLIVDTAMNKCEDYTAEQEV